MYSYEDRMKAIRLYEKYGKRPAAVVRELGYPNRRMLAKWYQEYKEGRLMKKVFRTPKFTEAQRKTAVQHYLTHGKNMSFTIQELFYR